MIKEKGEIYRWYKYKVIKMKMWFYNWYVKIPKKDKFFEKDYNDIMYIQYIQVHWGLTFSWEIIPTDTEKEKWWWIGFDTTHYDDMLYSEDGKIIWYNKDKHFVEEECKKIIKQLTFKI